MKIANADKLKKHFESVVDVHLFTVPTIQTIIDTFSEDEPKVGEWIYQENSEDLYGNKTIYECSNCHSLWNQAVYKAPNPEYCCKCGAHMVGGDKP